MTEEIAVTQTESAPVIPDLASLSPEQRQEWRETGDLPKKQDSAPAPQPKAESAPQSDTAPDSETGKPKQQPHLKTKDDTAKRFQELLDELKATKAEIAELRKPPIKRDEPKSQPAPEEIKAPAALRQFLEQYFKDNPKAQYEEGVEKWQEARDKFASDQYQKNLEKAISGERQRIQQESALQKTQEQFKDFQQRYPDVKPEALNEAAGALLDPAIPMGVKQALGGVENYMDVMYVLAGDAAEFQKFVDLAKTQPLNALRKVFAIESMVKEELSGKKQPKGEDGKFQKKEPVKEAVAEPVTKAPRPPVELGGRQSTPEDEGVAAVKANDFRRAKAEWTRSYTAANR